ncbi:MAG: DUF1631 family protein [Burkholderiales bacterium]|nr:DUF1631 family protein [Burkholderiales bacterium]
MSTEAVSKAIPTSAILKGCRDLMLHRSNLQFAAAFDRLSDLLMDNAVKVYEPKAVSALLDARSSLTRLRGAISAAFADELAARLDGKVPCAIPTAAASPAMELSLQSDAVLDEYVAARALARAIESASLNELPPLHQRIASIKGDRALKMDDDPFSPQSVVSSLMSALQKASDGGAQTHLQWLRGLSGLGGLGFNDVYADLNRHLADMGVSIPGARAAHAAGAVAVGTGHPDHGGAEGGRGSGTTFDVASAIAAAGGDQGGYSGGLSTLNTPSGGGLPLQQLASNLVSLVERLQQVVPTISGGPAATDPSLSRLVQSKEAMQVSAALGFNANGGIRSPLVAGVDRRLMETLSTLQANHEAFDFSAAPSAPRTVLREVVPGYASGEISVLDATTTELVAMLFDFVLDRRELRDEIKVLLGRLQIPMLKAAMLDRGFFSRKNHPARQLLNRLADTGLGWSPDDGIDDPLFCKIRDVVDHITRDFADDLGTFTAALIDMEQFIAEQELNAKPLIEAETAEAQAADRHLAAVREAKDIVDARVAAHALPQPVKEFIEVAWQPHLQDELLANGPESGEYKGAVEALDELIWSVSPKAQPAERAQLSQRVPSLVRRLRSGLKSLSDDTIAPFFDKLFEVHSGLLRGAQPEYVPPEEIPEASNDTPFDPFRALVKQMERNQWIEMSDEKGALTYAKLAWVSPQGTTYLFTTRHGRKAASLTPEELAEWFRTDRARMIESEPIVDRALVGMFQAA